MRTLRLISILSLLPLVAACALSAQTYTAARVQFSDLGPFTQQQLEDVVAIHNGTTFTAAQLATAAQRLVDTGYFDDVGGTEDGPIKAVTVIFTLKITPTSHLLPVRFSNFVWLTPAEIAAAIKPKVPLFNGYLSDNSPHQDEIKAALTAALAAKSITAEVAYETYEPTLQHPHREVGFFVDKPATRVANIKLQGVTPDLVPLIQKSVNATARTKYTEGPADQTTAESILAPLLDAGYIQATLSNAVATPSSADNGTVPVVLTATLTPGEIYRLSALTFAGTPLLSADAFAISAKLHPGDVASHRALLESLAPIDAAYRRKGYMDVIVDAVPTLDAATHQVAYAVAVTPGEQYRVHEVTPNNLDAAALADFNRGFLMKPGELYNPEYVTGFLKNNSALQALAGYSAGFKAYADPNTHTVDLVITFYRAAR